jgi:hypothetical protein
MEAVFVASNLLVLPFWFLMIVLPGWRGTRRVMASPLVLLPLPVVYTLLILPRVGELWPRPFPPSLPGIAAVLGTRAGAAIGWAIFLAFDLFVGRWVYLDSCERGIRWWLTAPVLFLTLMVGPLGLLAYLALRWLHGEGREAGQSATEKPLANPGDFTPQ